MRPAIAFLTLVVFSGSVRLPPNFQKCNRSNPDFKKCVLEAAKNGIRQMVRPYPELSVPNLDPYDLPQITIGGRNGPVSLEQKFKKCQFYGLPSLQLDDFEFNFERKFVSLTGTFPEIRMLCDYQMKGQILVVPVDGAGNSTIILKNIKVTDVLPFEEKKKKGRTYMKFKTSSITLDPELVIFNFQSWSDKAFTDTLNPVLNNNWEVIFEDVKGSYAEVIDKIILSLGNSVFSKVSKEEAFE